MGLSFGKNRGIALARGATILFTDDDTLAWTVVDLGIPGPLRQAWSWSLHRRRHDRAGTAQSRPMAPMARRRGPSGHWAPRLRERTDPGTRGISLGREHGRSEVRVRPLRIVRTRRSATVGVIATRSRMPSIRTGSVLRAPRCVSPRQRIRHRVDRKRITPRRLVANAFQRGRNEFYGAQVARWGAQPASWPRRRTVEGASPSARN